MRKSTSIVCLVLIIFNCEEELIAFLALAWVGSVT
jgi:hypothetical protein